MVAALLAAGCASPRPRPPVVTPSAPPVPIQITVHDDAGALEGVAIACSGDVGGTSDGFGRFFAAVPAERQIDCTFTADGYAPATVSWFAGWQAGQDRGALQTVYLTRTAPTNPHAAAGRLRLTGAGFRDDSGPVLPLYAHAGDNFSVYVRDAARAEAQLDDVAKAGYRGVRVWITLGCGEETAAGCRTGAFWRGREVGPDVTPDYWGKLDAYAAAVRARGLRLVASHGDVMQLRDRQGYMRQLAQSEAEAAIDFIDCANEGLGTSRLTAEDFARCIAAYKGAGGQGITSLTSVGEDRDEINAYSIPPADVYDVHGFRDNRLWDKVRHIFSVAYEGRLSRAFGIQSEPPGNGAEVTAIQNREEIDDEGAPLLGAAAFITRQAYVYFSGEGVILKRGLATETGFWTTPRLLDWLPADLLSFPLVFHSGDNNAFSRANRILAASGEGRVDCRSEGTSPGARFVCPIYGPPGSYRFPVVRAFIGKLCDFAAGVCEDLALRVGQSLDVNFRRGRVLVGAVQ